MAAEVVALTISGVSRVSQSDAQHVEAVLTFDNPFGPTSRRAEVQLFHVPAVVYVRLYNLPSQGAKNPELPARGNYT